MNASEIIETLGGTFKTAKLCGVSPSAVSQWRTNGIPSSKLIFVAHDLEKITEGKFHRKQVSNWQQVWPDLR